MGSLVTLDFVEYFILIEAGTTIVALASHNGGEDEVAFIMSQDVKLGSVIIKRADQPDFANLSNPKAISVRLIDNPTASISATEDFKVFSIYPNPSKAIVTVSNDNLIESTISVTDLTGKLLSTQRASNAVTLDFSNLGSGLFLISIENENGKHVERVIIE